MKSKYYTLAGLRLRADSETEIADSALYGEFYAPEGDCDIRVRVHQAPLPERPSSLIAHKADRDFYRDGGDVTLFSSYPFAEHTYRPYACRKGTGEQIDLTVDYAPGLWDAMLFHALNIPELMARRGRFLLHSSFIIYHGEALLFSADKGVGKSTQAALWERYRGALIVNGDRSLLQLGKDGLTAHGTPYCGSSEIALNRSAPVKAVVLLSQGPCNELRRCGGSFAMTRLLAQLSFESYQNENAVDFALGLCANVPVFSYQCLPDESAVTMLEESLWKN